MNSLNNCLVLSGALLVISGCKPDEPRLGGAEKLSATLFTDLTGYAGVNFIHNPGVEGDYYMPESLGSGGALFDFDNDGDLDIYLLNGAYRDGREALKNRLFRQDESWRFSDVTENSGLGDSGYGMGVAVGDIDNDGDLDVYISNFGPDALYRNNGDGTFTNITQNAAIHNPDWGCSVTFFDFNLDGYLDIYVANYVKYNPRVVCTDKAGRPDYCGPAGFDGEVDKLFRNNGDGTFSDVSRISGIANPAQPGKSLGVVSADFNEDGYPDIYVANDGEANQLWINRQNGTFQDEALVRGVALNEMGFMEAGMGIALGDADNDGKYDLFITHLRGESNTFYRNAGEFGFRDDTAPAHLEGISLPYTSFGTGFFDFDLDGNVDLAAVNGRVTRGPLMTDRRPPAYWDDYAEPNFLFENLGKGLFQKTGMNSSFCATVENSRGLAFGDVDNDGDIDLLVVNEGGPARLYRNDVPAKGHWLLVRAYDPLLKRDAIGARIAVAAGSRQWSRLVISGYSYLSANDLRVHFGLGDVEAVDQINIQWPGGEAETFPGVNADQFITLQKGSGKPTDG